MFMPRKIIVTAALLGGTTTRDKNPAVPYTAEEIAVDAVKCVKKGASIIHLHARDKNGVATMDVDTFRKIHDTTKAALDKEGLDCILNLSTGGFGPDEERVAHIVAVKPEMCSFNPGSINWGYNSVYYNSPAYLKLLGEACTELNVKPEFEIFDTTMFKNVVYGAEQGYIPKPFHFQFIMGLPGGMNPDMKYLSFLLDLMPEGSTWSITGIGKEYIPMMMLGLAAGAQGIRVGLEDNVWLAKGVPATNETLVERAVELVKLANCEVATAAEARQMLSMTR